MDAGHGGQVLIADVTAALVPGVVMRNLGEHRLRDLGGPVVVWQLGTDEFPSLRTLDQLPGNLPVELTSFVGRAEEVRAVAGLVAEHRLVTLTGVGGVGKTRLATQVAADRADRFADGVWLVELASIDAPRVVGAIARVLSVEIRAGASLEESLLDAIGSRELLLVLDNCEHVVREVRRVANELLRSTRGVSILATSREGLRVDGEQLFTVPSLDDDASARLFVERARAADAAFTPDEAGNRVIAELCERLDGVPLAIELAAARARMFSVAELASARRAALPSAHRRAGRRRTPPDTARRDRLVVRPPRAHRARRARAPVGLRGRRDARSRGSGRRRRRDAGRPGRRHRGEPRRQVARPRRPHARREPLRDVGDDPPVRAGTSRRVG